jgi:hypothetical protein
MSPNLIVWPMVLHALVTLFLYIPMSRARVRGVKEGKVRGSVYKLNEGEPAESLLFTNAIRNQNETGVLFYAGVLAALATGNAGALSIALAWAFFLAKTAHVIVHVLSNNLRYRRPVFMVAYLVIILFWLALAAQLAGIV